jgi:hypothetical protein
MSGRGEALQRTVDLGMRGNDQHAREMGQCLLLASTHAFNASPAKTIRPRAKQPRMHRERR